MSKPTASNPLEIKSTELKKAALVYRAVNHRLRQKILAQIHQQEKIKVTDIYVRLRLEQSVTSQHLAILRRAGIVTTERSGKMVFYSIQYERLQLLQELSATLARSK